MNIGVIDYEAGNACSVINALKKINFPGKLVRSFEELKKSHLIVLPGVGSAKATLDSLRQLDLIEGLTESVIHKQIPFLGICIGYQIIYEFSEEGDQLGLGWIQGSVKKFDTSKVLVPQIGWNQSFLVETHSQSHLFEFPSPYFYFVNSYYANPEGVDKSIGLYCTKYDQNFTSMILKDNIVATQFHLEKSGESGLRLLKKIIEYFATIK